MRQADVKSDDIVNVIGLWQKAMDEENAGEISELLGQAAWHLFEAEQHLIGAACIYLGIRAPRAVTFSCLDSIEGAGRCEAVLFWPKVPASSLNPDSFVEDTAVRIHEYRWPGEDLVVRRDEHIKYVVARMSLLRKAMDKEAPQCTFGG